MGGDFCNFSLVGGESPPVSPHFSSEGEPCGGSKSGENEFSGKKRKRHSLTFPNTKLHAKNQKNLTRGFPGKQGETDRETERQRRTRI